MEPVFGIALTNALINSTSAVLLVKARRAIKQRDVGAHARLMIVVTLLQALFLVLYLIKTAFYGTTPFVGDPTLRAVYLTVLLLHSVAATVNVPLVLVTLILGLKRKNALHRRWGRWTYPIWLFVSVTGPITFVLLYAFGRP
ncbi:MAG TPA: DUF420 domain-containing protein [Calditerricola sp.]